MDELRICICHTPSLSAHSLAKKTDHEQQSILRRTLRVRKAAVEKREEGVQSDQMMMMLDGK